MEDPASESDPLTLEGQFEVCIHSQDEDDEEYGAVAMRKKSMQSCNSLEYYKVEEFTEKYPGCFSVEYPTTIFEGIEHSMCDYKLSSTNISAKNALQPCSMPGLSAKQNEHNTPEYGPALQHVDAPYDALKSQKKCESDSQLYNPQKPCEEQEENPALDITHEGTLNKNISCAFTEGTFTSQHNSCQSNEGRVAEEFSVNGVICETNHNYVCQNVAMENDILDVSENKLTKTWEEKYQEKFSHKYHNKVLDKKISPKKFCANNHLEIRINKSLKNITKNIHHTFKTFPSHDIRLELPGQQNSKQTTTPHNEVTPSLYHERRHRRSAPPLLKSYSPSTSCQTPTPLSLNTVEGSLTYQSTDDNCHDTWNVKQDKNGDPIGKISKAPEHEVWKVKSPTNPEALNTFPFETPKSSHLSWRKTPRRSLDWPRASNTTFDASKQPSKYLNVSPLSWRPAPGTSLNYVQNQPFRKRFQYKVKADFDDKELQVKAFAPGFIDTHCHLDFLFERVKHRKSYSEFRENTKDPFPVSYEGCVTIFCKPWTFEKVSWWETIIMEPKIWAAFGCHPHFADHFGEEANTYLKAALMNSKTVALGEIGLDYYKNSPNKFETQKVVFRWQLKLAMSMKKPVIIHCRDAHKDCMDIIKEILPLNYRIHLHCFTGTWREAEEWLETFNCLFVGITNLINNHEDMRSYKLQMAVKRIPLHRLLLETDAPYFRPPFLQEGQTSHPGMALYVAAQVAHLKGEELQVVLDHVRHNTKLMYGI